MEIFKLPIMIILYEGAVDGDAPQRTQCKERK